MSSKNAKTEESKDNLPAPQATGTALQAVDFGDDAGSGVENVSAAELRIPFLVQLQPLSPQVKPLNAGGLPGAQPGMLLNGGTGELLDISERPLPFLPVYRDHKFLEFTPRNLGGGFVAMYEPTDPLIEKLRGEQSRFGKLVRNNTKGRNEKGELLDGTEIIETFTLFGIFDPFNEFTGAFRAALGFKSTQIKKYQNFMGRVTSFKYANPKSTDANPLPAVIPPLWAHVWDLNSTFESNKKGDFYGLRLSLHGKKADGSEDAPIKSLVPRTSEVYQEAKAFHEMLKSGAAKADFNTDQGDAEGGDRHADTPPM